MKRIGLIALVMLVVFILSAMTQATFDLSLWSKDAREMGAVLIGLTCLAGILWIALNPEY